MDSPDTTAAEWRGHISAKVGEYGRRLDGHDADVRELRVSANATTVELVRLGTSVEGLRSDITRALAEQADQRSNEFAELQAAVTGNRMTSKEKMAQIAIPLIVAVIGALVILLSTRVI